MRGNICFDFFFSLRNHNIYIPIVTRLFKDQRSGSKTVCGFSIILILKGIMASNLKSKNPCILLNKNINFIKNETESKMENPTHSFRETNLVLQPYKNRKFKVKLRWVGARERKKRAFFVPIILSKGNFFNICVLSQCKLYWIPFQNIYTFSYIIKDITLYTFSLIFKIVESLKCILNFRKFHLKSSN